MTPAVPGNQLSQGVKWLLVVGKVPAEPITCALPWGLIMEINSFMCKSFWLSTSSHHCAFCSFWRMDMFKLYIHLKSEFLFGFYSEITKKQKPRHSSPCQYFYNVQSLLVKAACVFSSVSQNNYMQMPKDGYRDCSYWYYLFQCMDIVWMPVTIYILGAKLAYSKNT